MGSYSSLQHGIIHGVRFVLQGLESIVEGLRGQRRVGGLGIEFRVLGFRVEGQRDSGLRV
jgi:hypothetical protein